MDRADGSRGSRAWTTVPALLLCLLAACATMEPPRGGPEDKTPPVVVSVFPDSAATGLRGVGELEIVFSEKMDPLPAERFLELYPPLRIAKTKWNGRRVARVVLLDSLPADTVLVVEIPAGHADAHRVRSLRTRRYPLATADSLPPGRLRLALQQGDTAVVRGVVELYAVPPDTLEWFRQDPLRRAETDSLGRVELPWLPAPGGPWLLRGYVDANGDLRPGENEAQRLLPIEAALSAEAPVADLGVFTLYAPQDPGRLFGPAPDPAPWTGAVFAWTTRVADQDTGFAPAHAAKAPAGQTGAAPDDTLRLDPAGPGPVRVVLFVDLDGDSLLSALPDSSAVDTVLWHWEPYALLEDLEVEPGLPLRVGFPGFADTLAVCAVPPPRPEPAPADTLAAAPADTLDTATEAP